MSETVYKVLSRLECDQDDTAHAYPLHLPTQLGAKRSTRRFTLSPILPFLIGLHSLISNICMITKDVMRKHTLQTINYSA